MNEFKNAYDANHIVFSHEESRVWAKIKGCAELGLFVVYGRLEACCPTTDASFGLATFFVEAVANRRRARELTATHNEEFFESLECEPSGAGWFVFGPEDLEPDLEAEKLLEDARDVEVLQRLVDPDDDFPF